VSEVDLRASDDDRERAALRLRDAAADGRLTLEELADRVGAAYAARTHAELEQLTRDLPAASAAPARRARRKVVAVMSGAQIRGRTRIEGTLRVIAAMGGVELDLREAEVVGEEVAIHLVAVMGGVEITVPRGVEVDAHDVVTIMGGREVRVPDARPGAPRIRIHGFVCMGGLEVRAR
jgi:Domain of unknown function (DUF1707)